MSAETPIPVSPTGIDTLDTALGIGGLPKGHLTEIFGVGEAYKTLTLTVVAAAQERGATCAYIDSRHDLTLSRVRDLGVDVSRLLISQPESMSHALTVVDALARSGAVDIIVVDQILHLVQEAERDAIENGQNPTFHGRLLSRGLRQLKASCAWSGCLAVFVESYPEFPTGSGRNAIRFHVDVRLEVVHNDYMANQTRIGVLKNNLVSPFKTVETYCILP